MPTTFENAIIDLVATAEEFTGFDGVERACAVRDLRGRVRLVVKGGEALDVPALSAALEARLRRWFHGPVLSTRAGSPAEVRLATEVLARSRPWPTFWPTRWTDVSGEPHAVSPERWRGVQSVLSKQAWLDGAAGRGAWPMVAQAPVIVAFYSFKGGVGRSTLLGVMAWQLARLGQKVVCVDLDVEAPGLGSMLRVRGETSVLEHLLTFAATGQAPPDDPVQEIDVRGAKIGVVPAGSLGRAYVEKLARLDYLGAAAADDSPVAQALHALLFDIRRRHRPDYILLDCRAGIHDLGGLSLNDLAHVDVLVGRDNPQGREGMELTLQVLAAHRAPQDRRVLLVQTFVPMPLYDEPSQVSQARYRAAMLAACEKTLYAGLDDVPAEGDDQAAHFPWPVGQLPELAAFQHLEDISEATLNSPELNNLCARLQALAAEEDDDARTEQ